MPHPIEGASTEDAKAAASTHQHLGLARGAHDQANHERVASRMRNTIPLIEGDGCLRPPELCWGSQGVDGVHLLLSDAALSVGFVRLGAPEDHEAVLGLVELGVLLLGAVCRCTGLQDRLLGLALLAESATDVASNSSAVHEKVLRLPPVERVGGLNPFSKCSRHAHHPRG
jgi:hypothetical protein